jgi:membrane protein YqaA with SNARE-associated domain
VPVASITSSITSFIGNHGVYAVFVLMAIDAVFPAASELVMLYAGALAAGTFAGQSVVLFGHDVPFGFWSFVVMALAGTLGYLVGALVGWAIGAFGGRPLLERRGRWLHLPPPTLERAEGWFDRWGGFAVRRPLVRLDSRRRLPLAARAVHRAHPARLRDLVLRLRRRRLGDRAELHGRPRRLPLRRLRGRRGRRRRPCLARRPHQVP